MKAKTNALCAAALITGAAIVCTAATIAVIRYCKGKLKCKNIPCEPAEELFEEDEEENEKAAPLCMADQKTEVNFNEEQNR